MKLHNIVKDKMRITNRIISNYSGLLETIKAILILFFKMYLKIMLKRIIISIQDKKMMPKIS